MLRARHVPHDNGSAERVDEVAAVWVHDHTAMNAACNTTGIHMHGLALLSTSTTTRIQLERTYLQNQCCSPAASHQFAPFFYNKVVVTTMAEKSN